MEMSSETKVGWDSNLCIDYLDKVPTFLEYLKGIVTRAQEKKISIWCSDLAIIESCKFENIDEKIQTKTVLDFFNEYFIEPVAIDRRIAIEAHKIRRMNVACQYDSIHLATCIIWNIHIFLTHDGLKKTKKLPLLPLDQKLKTSDGKKLRIITPKQYFETVEKELKQKKNEKAVKKEKASGQTFFLDHEEPEEEIHE